MKGRSSGEGFAEEHSDSVEDDSVEVAVVTSLSGGSTSAVEETARDLQAAVKHSARVPRTPTARSKSSCWQCGRGSDLCPIHGVAAGTDASDSPLLQLTLRCLPLTELRASPRCACRKWKCAVASLEVRLTPAQMDDVMRAKLFCMLSSCSLTPPCAASAMYGVMRRRRSPPPPYTDELERMLAGEGADGAHLVDWSPDVRRSSFRTLGKFVKAMAKEGVVSVKEVRKEMQITAIGRFPHVGWLRLNQDRLDTPGESVQADVQS